MFELIHYCDADGRDLFARWLDSISDMQARARVAARLVRLQNANFGDCKPLGDGVWEIRIDWGAGYRVYYALAGKQAILLCEGGRQANSVGRYQESQAALEIVATKNGGVRCW